MICKCILMRTSELGTSVNVRELFVDDLPSKDNANENMHKMNTTIYNK